MVVSGRRMDTTALPNTPGGTCRLKYVISASPELLDGGEVSRLLVLLPS